MRSLDAQAERAAALITALEKVLSWKPDVDEVQGDLLYLRAPAGEAEASAGDKASALRARNPRKSFLSDHRPPDRAAARISRGGGKPDTRCGHPMALSLHVL